MLACGGDHKVGEKGGRGGGGGEALFKIKKEIRWICQVYQFESASRASLDPAKTCLNLFRGLKVRLGIKLGSKTKWKRTSICFLFPAETKIK